MKMETLHNRVRALFVTLLLLVLGLYCFVDISSAEANQIGELPKSFRIANMPVYAQQHSLSCEYSATRAAINRWGGNIQEWEFIQAIGFDPNPHLAFRGNIDGPFGGTWDYGIYAEPIALYLANRGFNTKLLSRGVEELKAELAKGRPVVVWIPAGLSWGNPYSTDYKNLKFKLMPLEHAVTLYGYDEGGVYVADPGYGTYNYYGWDGFIRSWKHLDSMAMSVWPSDMGYEVSETIGVSPFFYRHWLNDGGMSVYGHPISGEMQENGKVVQYFERARLEYDPNGAKEQTIGIAKLGTELAASRSNEIYFQPVPAPEPDSGVFYVAESQHTISPFFVDKWLKGGSWINFGLPISEPFNDGDKYVQYFERARLEFRADSGLFTYGLLGSEYLFQKSLKGINLQNLLANLVKP
jgi:uncharacterized protein YvpB